MKLRTEPVRGVIACRECRGWGFWVWIDRKALAQGQTVMTTKRGEAGQICHKCHGTGAVLPQVSIRFTGNRVGQRRYERTLTNIKVGPAQLDPIPGDDDELD